MRPLTESFLETIVALATPPGRSALALVRLSGPGTKGALARLCPDAPETWPPRRATLAALVDASGGAIDRGLVTFFPAPASYTGEDVAEISVHGSPIVVDRLLQAASHAGARAARPGEFTERAFLHGKMDLPRAEAVADLVDSQTPAAARRSLERMEGGISRRFASSRERLVAAAAALSATIDFAEDVGESVPNEVSESLRAAAADLTGLLATYEAGRLLAAGCRVVIVGPPNAGKSTLFNALCGSARALVTDIPGTTRDALEASIDVAGVPITVVDTAGLRQSDELVERLGVARAREEVSRADAIVWVRPAAGGFPERDPDLPELERARLLVKVANRADEASSDRLAAARAEGALTVCGLDPAAGPLLRERLARELRSRLPSEETSELLCSARQRDLASRALAEVERASAALDRGEAPEYVASPVNGALAALADLLGETTPDDVLARIFASFCIGK
jgi:tRNA modification GTPase